MTESREDEVSFRDMLMGRKQSSFDSRELKQKVEDAISGKDLETELGYGDKLFVSTQVSCAVAVGAFALGRGFYIRRKMMKAKKYVSWKPLIKDVSLNTLAAAIVITPIWMHHQPEKMATDYFRTMLKINDPSLRIQSDEELEYAGFNVLGSKMTKKEYDTLMFKLSTGQIKPGHALQDSNKDVITDLKGEYFQKRS